MPRKVISRRAFARETILIAGGAAVVPNLIAEEPAGKAEIDARVAWIRGKYGKQLTDDQLADIRRLITGGQEGLEAMRKYALDNAVEPATPFRIYRRTR